jgi:hypothetical protein
MGSRPTFEYGLRRVWHPSFKEWNDDIVAFNRQSNALVWMHVMRSGINDCHVLADGLFAWFCVRGEPIWVEPADRQQDELVDADKQWDIGLMSLETWNDANGQCPVTPDNLVMMDWILRGKMKAADEAMTDHIYALAIPALAWWPTFVPAASAQVPARPEPRRVHRTRSLRGA